MGYNRLSSIRYVALGAKLRTSKGVGLLLLNIFPFCSYKGTLQPRLGLMLQLYLADTFPSANIEILHSRGGASVRCTPKGKDILTWKSLPLCIPTSPHFCMLSHSGLYLQTCQLCQGMWICSCEYLPDCTTTGIFQLLFVQCIITMNPSSL